MCAHVCMHTRDFEVAIQLSSFRVEPVCLSPEFEVHDLKVASLLQHVSWGLFMFRALCKFQHVLTKTHWELLQSLRYLETRKQLTCVQNKGDLALSPSLVWAYNHGFSCFVLFFNKTVWTSKWLCGLESCTCLVDKNLYALPKQSAMLSL